MEGRVVTFVLDTLPNADGSARIFTTLSTVKAVAGGGSSRGEDAEETEAAAVEVPKAAAEAEAEGAPAEAEGAADEAEGAGGMLAEETKAESEQAVTVKEEPPMPTSEESERVVDGMYEDKEGWRLLYRQADVAGSDLASIVAHMHATDMKPYIEDDAPPGAKILLLLRCLDKELNENDVDKVFVIFALHICPRMPGTPACKVGHDYVVTIGAERARVLACMLVHPTSARARSALMTLLQDNLRLDHYLLLTSKLSIHVCASNHASTSHHHHTSAICTSPYLYFPLSVLALSVLPLICTSPPHPPPLMSWMLQISQSAHDAQDGQAPTDSSNQDPQFCDQGTTALFQQFIQVQRVSCFMGSLQHACVKVAASATAGKADAGKADAGKADAGKDLDSNVAPAVTLSKRERWKIRFHASPTSSQAEISEEDWSEHERQAAGSPSSHAPSAATPSAAAPSAAAPSAAAPSAAAPSAAAPSMRKLRDRGTTAAADSGSDSASAARSKRSRNAKSTPPGFTYTLSVGNVCKMPSHGNRIVQILQVCVD